MRTLLLAIVLLGCAFLGVAGFVLAIVAPNGAPGILLIVAAFIIGTCAGSTLSRF